MQVETFQVFCDLVETASFSEAALSENIKAFVRAINGAKPSGAKGTYIKRVAVSSTMGPGVKLDVSTLAAPTSNLASVLFASAVRAGPEK